MTPILEVRGLRVRYGAIEAVKGISLTVGQAEIVTLIGGNGAGKTTTLKSISSVLRPAAGEILFEGQRTDRLPAHEVVREINAQGTPILLVEQNAQMALQTAQRGYVLESGMIVLEDEAAALLGNDQVRKSYLGTA